MEKFRGKPLALLSVTDKTGVLEFARGLLQLGFGILSTGGTAKLLREAGLPVLDVAEYTGSPEILDGRVKTLHPKVHGAILFDRNNPAHTAEAFQAGIGQIDLVAVNLYQFRNEVLEKNLTLEQAIHHIDIGGPTMIRAAAKNWLHTIPVIDPLDYAEVLAALGGGKPSASFRQRLAAKAFRAVSDYDDMIATFFAESQKASLPSKATSPFAEPNLTLKLSKLQDLRYGENPQQASALYQFRSGADLVGFADVEICHGKELSYNNILDIDAAAALVSEFDEPAVVIVKHTNPCGVASGGEDLALLYRRAFATDEKSAFGGIVAVNRPITEALAREILGVFTECVAAPDFSAEALAILKQKKDMRLLRAPFTRKRVSSDELTVRSVRGALLLQTADSGQFDVEDWQVVTERGPSWQEIKDLRFAMMVAKHVKSNAIVFARDQATIGIGAGQMSRVDSAQVAISKAAAAGLTVRGSVMASDAFFPFRDTVDTAAENGVHAVIQPGGSKRDQDSIDAANTHRVAMVFTGERHFRH